MIKEEPIKNDGIKVNLIDNLYYLLFDNTEN